MSSWTRRAATGATAVAVGAGSLLAAPTVAFAAVDAVMATIPEIQGTGDVSPMVDDVVVVRGVVTAAWPTGGFNAFTIQVPGSGGAIDPASHDGSQGLYVQQADGEVAVAIGDHVQVTGTVGEVDGLTTVTAPTGADVEALSTGAEPVTALTLPSWPTTEEEREDLESMLYLPTGEFTVTNTYTTNQYGEVGLAYGDMPLLQPTDVALPGTPEAALVAADNAARAVILDDGASTNYLRTGNGDLVPPYVSLTEPVRVGASVEFTQPVVVGFGFGSWRLQPRTTVTGAQSPESDGVVFENTRTTAPDATRLGDGELTVASFNVLNYFTTLGADTAGCEAYTDPDGDPVSVRTGCAPRGAWDPEDLARQQSKIVDAINALDTSVVGLMEIENSLVVDGVADEAVATLVDALNAEAGAGTWAYVPSSDELPPVEEMDVITNAIIYQPAQVETVGEQRVLAELSGTGEPFENAREPVGQVFAPADGGEPFFVAVNHFKSKGSGEGPGNDEDTGQGLSNADRVAQATALRDWVPTVLDDHGTAVEDVFLVGDFNAYGFEDPMVVLYDEGYTNVNLASGEPEFSYSFQGRSGSLDHVVANAPALERVTGVDIWDINAVESVALEYSRYNYHGELFWAEGPYRSSDHDPVVVAFTATEPTPVFSDVTEDNRFAEAIAWVAARGIAEGYDDGTYRPTAPVSRQAMAAFLYRLTHDGADAPACESAPFVDVAVANQFCGEIAWMVEHGIAEGYVDETFRPTAPVSRQATAAFLYRLFNDGGTAPACDGPVFGDLGPSNPFCGEIEWLVDRGIAQGYEDDTFRAVWPVSRQAMAAFLFRTESLPV